MIISTHCAWAWSSPKNDRNLIMSSHEGDHEHDQALRWRIDRRRRNARMVRHVSPQVAAFLRKKIWWRMRRTSSVCRDVPAGRLYNDRSSSKNSAQEWPPAGRQALIYKKNKSYPLLFHLLGPRARFFANKSAAASNVIVSTANFFVSEALVLPSVTYGP